MHEFSVYDTDVAVDINHSYLLSHPSGQIVSFVSATGLGGPARGPVRREAEQRQEGAGRPPGPVIRGGGAATG